jgi:hypothetical protein
MTESHYTFCIIGYGIAGQLLSLELLQNTIKPTTICICDKSFLGGALATMYPTVLSNTPWWKTRKALEKYTSWNTEALQEGDSKYGKDDCMPVLDISRLCALTANNATNGVCKITTTVNEIQKTESEIWRIKHQFGTFTATTVFLVNGAEQKYLDISQPTISLSIALDKEQLKHHLDPKKDRVTVFGLSHSGTIILKNLHDLSIETTGVYKTKAPFYFSRDGVYNGIKEASATIADSILKGEYTKTTLIPWSDPIAVHKSLMNSTKCIYCIGFQTIPINGTTVHYDPSNASIKDMKHIYGFGIAYPGVSIIDGISYVDVSVLSFQEQIQRCLPTILEPQQ